MFPATTRELAIIKKLLPLLVEVTTLADELDVKKFVDLREHLFLAEADAQEWLHQQTRSVCRAKPTPLHSVNEDSKK